MTLPPGPPCRKTKGSGAGWARGLGKMATARRIVRPWGTVRSSGTTTKPQRTSLPATIPAPSLKWQAVGTNWGVAACTPAARRHVPTPEPTRTATTAIPLIQFIRRSLFHASWHEPRVRRVPVWHSCDEGYPRLLPRQAATPPTHLLTSGRPIVFQLLRPRGPATFETIVRRSTAIVGNKEAQRRARRQHV